LEKLATSILREEDGWSQQINIPARTVLGIVYHPSPKSKAALFRASHSDTVPRPPFFLAVFFKTTHFNPVFLLVL
jgi:hypothetical protein